MLLTLVLAAGRPSQAAPPKILNAAWDKDALGKGVVIATPENKGAAVLFTAGGADWRAHDVVEMRVRLKNGDMELRDLRAALGRGREWIALDASQGWTAPLEPERWRSVYFDLGQAGRDKVDVFRLYFNARGRLDGKSVEFELGEPRPFRAEIVRQIPMEPKPGAPRPRLFPRNQVKYTFFMNYLSEPGFFLDRPLFCDRTLGEDVIGSRAGSYENFVAYANVLKEYGADGFGYLCARRSYLDRTLTALKYSERLNSPDFTFLPEVTPGGFASEPYLDDLFAPVLAAKTVWRRDGKAVFSSYCADNTSPAAMGKELEALQRKYPGQFLYVAEIRTVFGAASRSHGQHGGVPRHELEAMRDYLREWLDVADGILFAGCNHHAKAPRFLDFNDACYRDIVTPLMRSVVNEPRYRGKLLGLSAATGYVSHLSNSCLLERGTRTLRQSMEIALAAKPDFIVMPEWNEFHENTNVEPTIYNSLANLRVIRHYTREMKGLPAAPREGDDPATPNLILSYRSYLTLGEPLEVEVLNVPDGHAGQVHARVTLRDLTGAEVARSEARALALDRLDAADFTWPSERFAGHAALRVGVEVAAAGGAGRVFDQNLPHIRLSPASVRHKKCVRRPLRDLYRPTAFETAWAPGGDRVDIRVAGKETLRSVEVVKDDVPWAAIDPDNEFALKPGEAFMRARWEGWSRSAERYKSFDISVEGGKLVSWRRGARGAEAPGKSASVDGVIKVLDARPGPSPQSLLLKITQPEQTRVVFSSGAERWAAPVDEARRRGRLSRTLKDAFTWSLEEVQALPDLPMPLDRAEASASLTLKGVQPGDLLSVRVITKDGKTLDSKPFLVAPADGFVAMPVESETAGGPVVVRAPRWDAAEVRYVFDPSRGCMLPARAERPSDADAFLGGQTRYGDAFFAENRAGHYPPTATDTAPQWLKGEAGWELAFDGKGNYVVIPARACPVGAFTLEFEILPASRKRQTLVQTFGVSSGGLHVAIENGRLEGRFTNIDGETFAFKTDDVVEAGVWSRVTVVYDLKTMAVRVNGKEAGAWPARGRVKRVRPLIFGGFGSGTAWFEGRLRALRISPAVE
ncbi:MAG TPA: hypothetical protein P5137_05345 [Candidatus Brocadiia bacterium]|nr:hypothetical protein [Candidatus Brocadiia bacterium]